MDMPSEIEHGFAANELAYEFAVAAVPFNNFNVTQPIAGNCRRRSDEANRGE
jgi:hypothetical protein